jgi:hypothetical protein
LDSYVLIGGEAQDALYRRFAYERMSRDGIEHPLGATPQGDDLLGDRCIYGLKTAAFFIEMIKAT